MQTLNFYRGTKLDAFHRGQPACAVKHEDRTGYFAYAETAAEARQTLQSAHPHYKGEWQITLESENVPALVFPGAETAKGIAA